ncbi:MAG: glycosyl transferase GT4 family protein, partial [Chloroflexota bacterium]
MRLLVTQETDWLKRGPHQQHHLFERLAARGHSVTVLDFEILYTPWPRAPLFAPRQEWPAVRRTPT